MLLRAEQSSVKILIRVISSSCLEDGPDETECGGATGSSKVHTEASIEVCGAEVQKGNAPTERKIQRLFRREEVSRLIKKCNDFGAGGVSVAIGELADGLRIDLDKVPKKYAGLDGTELAISESQERMAVVVDPKDVDAVYEVCIRGKPGGSTGGGCHGGAASGPDLERQRDRKYFQSISGYKRRSSGDYRRSGDAVRDREIFCKRRSSGCTEKMAGDACVT